MIVTFVAVVGVTEALDKPHPEADAPATWHTSDTGAAKPASGVSVAVVFVAHGHGQVVDTLGHFGGEAVDRRFPERSRKRSSARLRSWAGWSAAGGLLFMAE